MSGWMCWAVGAAVLVACAGCGAGEDAGPRSAAESFERALENADGAGACALLAPETKS